MNVETRSAVGRGKDGQAYVRKQIQLQKQILEERRTGATSDTPNAVPPMLCPQCCAPSAVPPKLTAVPWGQRALDRMPSFSEQ